MMGATIDVQSRPGGGTCFTVVLPIHIPLASQSLTLSSQSSTSGVVASNSSSLLL
jgi:chemotaxis protein histidine kinase CheA